MIVWEMGRGGTPGASSVGYRRIKVGSSVRAVSPERKSNPEMQGDWLGRLLSSRGSCGCRLVLVQCKGRRSRCGLQRKNP